MTANINDSARRKTMTFPMTSLNLRPRDTKMSMQMTSSAICKCSPALLELCTLAMLI